MFSNNRISDEIFKHQFEISKLNNFISHSRNTYDALLIWCRLDEVGSFFISPNLETRVHMDENIGRDKDLNSHFSFWEYFWNLCILNRQTYPLTFWLTGQQGPKISFVCDNIGMYKNLYYERNLSEHPVSLDRNHIIMHHKREFEIISSYNRTPTQSYRGKEVSSF